MAAAIVALRETLDSPGPWRWLRRIAAATAGLRGWRRVLLAMVLGALAALALPPLYVIPILIPAFTGLVWMIDGARNWRVALGIGLCFSMGHLTAGAGRRLAFVRTGTLEDPADCPPDIHIFTSTKLPWYVIPEGVPAVPDYYDRKLFWPAASLDRRAAALGR